MSQAKHCNRRANNVQPFMIEAYLSQRGEDESFETDYWFFFCRDSKAALRLAVKRARSEGFVVVGDEIEIDDDIAEVNGDDGTWLQFEAFDLASPNFWDAQDETSCPLSTLIDWASAYPAAAQTAVLAMSAASTALSKHPNVQKFMAHVESVIVDDALRPQQQQSSNAAPRRAL